MPQLGYKPSGNARGVGTLDQGRAKVTYLGSFAKSVWVTEVGFRGGKTGSGTPSAAPVFMDFNPSGIGMPTSLIYSPTPKSINARMPANDRTAGQNYSWQVTNLPIRAKRHIAGGVWNDDNGGGGQIAYGQNASGARMFRDNTAPSPPNPWSDDFNSPEGDIDVWMIGVENVRPTVQIVSPASGAQTELTPQITIRFSDPNSAQGDYIAKYLIEIWNGNTRVATSGVQNTTGPQQAAGQLTWTAPALTANVYSIRAYVYDRMDEVSLPDTRSFTAQPAGSFTGINVPDVVGETAEGTDVVLATSPTIAATWQHPDGNQLVAVEVRITGGLFDTVVRGPYLMPVFPSLDPGDEWVFGFAVPSPDWAPLAPSLFSYRYEFRGMDDEDTMTPWIGSERFLVNSPPSTPTDHSPANGTAFVTAPALEASVMDVNDGSASLQNVRFEIQKITGGATAEVPARFSPSTTRPARFVERGDVVSKTIKSVFFATQGLGAYRWRVLGEDPWGAQISPADGWHTFDIVNAPDVTMVYPTNGQTINTGAPLVDYTVDRPQTHQRLRIYRVSDNAQMWDSGEVATATTAIQVAEGLLDNGNYRGELLVRTSDGLSTTEIFLFTVSYTRPAALSNVVIQQEQSSVYDSAGGHGHPQQTPNVRITWTAVTTATVPLADWRGYRIVRTGQNGKRRVWSIMDMAAAVFVDTTTGRDDYTYEVYYVRTMNAGAAIVQSVPVVREEAIVLRYATLRSLNPDDPAVTLHYWDERGDRDQPDVRIRKGWETHPKVFQGPYSAMEIRGRFEAWDHPLDLYSCRDLIEDLRSMKEAKALGDGEYAPQIYWYADPKGRECFVIITMLETDDQYEDWRWVADVDLQEVGDHPDEVTL